MTANGGPSDKVGSVPGALQLTEEDLARLRDAIHAYFRGAGHLADAAITLRLAAMTIEDDDDSLLDQLGAIRPAGEAELVVDAESDREFLADRAATYEAKVGQMTEWGCAILAELSRWFEARAPDRSDAPVTVQTLDDMLRDYRREIDGAAREVEGIATALHATRYTDTEGWEEPLAHLGIAIQFLAGEAALFDSLLEDD